MALIWLSSSRTWPQTQGWLSDWPRWALVALTVVPPDKVVHSAIYAVLAALWLWALAPQRGVLGGLGVPWTAATLFGALDELHQGYVAGRSRDGWDVLADALGAGLVCVGLWWWRRRRMRRGESSGY